MCEASLGGSRVAAEGELFVRRVEEQEQHGKIGSLDSVAGAIMDEGTTPRGS
jgi:hypothetical protein